MEFNRAQIAEAFGVELTSVDKWRRSGCPSEKVGKSVMFSVREVCDWLQIHKVKREQLQRAQQPRWDIQT